MARVAVIEGDGRLGRRVADGLRRHGHDPLVVDRGAPSLARGVDGVISTIVAGDDDAWRAVGAAVTAGVPFIDADHLDPWIVEVERATDGAGTTALPGAGVLGLLGVRLAAVAATTVEAPVSAHVTHAVPHLGTPGRRHLLTRALSATGRVVVAGDERDEFIGEVARPAYMPRPTGPRRAVSYPSAEPLRLRRRIPGLREARAYAVLPGSLVAALPLLRALVRRPGGRRLVDPTLRAAGLLARADRVAGRGWVVLAEVSDGDHTARAWAEGDDLDGATAEMLIAGMERALVGDPGVPEPVGADEDALDALTRAIVARWALQPPQGAEHG